MKSYMGHDKGFVQDRLPASGGSGAGAGYMSRIPWGAKEGTVGSLISSGEWGYVQDKLPAGGGFGGNMFGGVAGGGTKCQDWGLTGGGSGTGPGGFNRRGGPGNGYNEDRNPLGPGSIGKWVDSLRCGKQGGLPAQAGLSAQAGLKDGDPGF